MNDTITSHTHDLHGLSLETSCIYLNCAQRESELSLAPVFPHYFLFFSLFLKDIGLIRPCVQIED